MNPQLLPPLDTDFGGKICHSLKGLDVLRTTIGIAAVVESVHTDEDVVCSKYLGPGERDGEENGVAGWNVRHGNVALHVLNRAILGNLDVGRQRGTAER